MCVFGILDIGGCAVTHTLSSVENVKRDANESVGDIVCVVFPNVLCGGVGGGPCVALRLWRRGPASESHKNTWGCVWPKRIRFLHFQFSGEVGHETESVKSKLRKFESTKNIAEEYSVEGGMEWR